MSEMVDRVAKAIFDVEYADLRRPRPEVHPEWAVCLSKARAAIEMMREPTDHMKAAGDDQIPDNIGYTNDASGIYRAMIDAALK